MPCRHYAMLPLLILLLPLAITRCWLSPPLRHFHTPFRHAAAFDYVFIIITIFATPLRRFALPFCRHYFSYDAMLPCHAIAAADATTPFTPLIAMPAIMPPVIFTLLPLIAATLFRLRLFFRRYFHIRYAFAFDTLTLTLIRCRSPYCLFLSADDAAYAAFFVSPPSIFTLSRHYAVAAAAPRYARIAPRL